MSHRPLRSVSRVTTVLLTMLAAAGLAACAARMSAVSAPAPTPPPAAAATSHIIPVSVTMLLQAAPLGDAPAQPLYTLVADNTDWDRLDGRIPEAALQAGRQAGATGDVVIVAFAGVKGSSGYQVRVGEAALQAGELIVTVAVTAPAADDIVEPASTLPFALAAIPRDALAAVDSYTIVDERGHTLIHNQSTTPLSVP